VATRLNPAAVAYKILEYMIIFGGCGFIIYVGVTKLDAACSHTIALWLIVEGCVTIAARLWWLAVSVKTKNPYAELTLNLLPRPLFYLSVIYGLFQFAWWIVGHVWIYRSHWGDCDHLLYLTGFWFIIAFWILGCANCCALCVCGGMSLSQIRFQFQQQ